MTPELLNTWILQIARDKMDPQDVAEAWVKSNKAVVDEWLNGM